MAAVIPFAALSVVRIQAKTKTTHAPGGDFSSAETVTLERVCAEELLADGDFCGLQIFECHL